MAIARASGLPRGTKAVADLTDGQLLGRFAAAQDEAAFQALVERHGPLVLGVCRRVLGNVHDAEDAFQATFLLLVRKAGTLGKPELVGNWLYGAACRVALKAKSNAARRRRLDREVSTMGAAGPGAEGDSHDVPAILAEEIERLPEKYRAPVVLCYLEGKTHAEAAKAIGCPPGSISWRLGQARASLRKRLKRHGLAVTAGLLLWLLSQQRGVAAVPDELIRRTVCAGTRLAKAGGGSAHAVVPGPVAALVEAALGELVAARFSKRTRVLALLLLLIGSACILAVALEVWAGRGSLPAAGSGAIPPRMRTPPH
jgi:RNA polymerase sigma factor (sigma-70 family)